MKLQNLMPLSHGTPRMQSTAPAVKPIWLEWLALGSILPFATRHLEVRGVVAVEV